MKGNMSFKKTSSAFHELKIFIIKFNFILYTK